MSINLASYMESATAAPQLPEPEARLFAANLHELTGIEVYPHSIAAAESSLFFLGREGTGKLLGIISASPSVLGAFTGEPAPVTMAESERTLLLCPASPSNAAALRSLLPFLTPQTIGLKKSAGCGDRLGLATPGHVRAFAESPIAPFFAQQSMRENARTGRTPQQVVDDATWGIFQEGWRYGHGADADHLKVAADIDLCLRSGYTLYTFDPGDHVDNSAAVATAEAMSQQVDALPWDLLESTPADLRMRMAGKTFDLGDRTLTVSPGEVLRAAAKYGKAVAHTAAMYRHLALKAEATPFEVEVSVDETDSVTTLAEHIYIASELSRLGVKWVSLAPRYVGSFEKGVDYIGDLGEFERSFAGHVSVARTFGPYKLSLHSGSDKFSIYPIASRLAGGLVHLKTAGTSYLEALRAVSVLRPALFRQVMSLAMERYVSDRVTYHVSADLARIPGAAGTADEGLPALLDDFHARQVLHVTFGSVMQAPNLRELIFETLRDGEETYYGMLERHFRKHLAPFEVA
jgi:hypothetical protein